MRRVRQRFRAGVRGRIRALRTRNFRLFFIGQLVSNTGTWMQRVAQDWLVLNRLCNGRLPSGLS